MEKLSPVASSLLSVFSEKEKLPSGKKITVNYVVSEIASWYEKLRNSMDYREDEVILRAAIERILKRRLLLTKDGKKMAEPILRELVWARYFSNNSLPESDIENVGDIINTYLLLKKRVLETYAMKEGTLSTFILHIMSAEIAKTVSPQKKREAMTNFMFHTLKDSVTILDDSQVSSTAQIFLSVRRAFAKDDIAFLRYHLFHQIFGEPREEKVKEIVRNFKKGYLEIERELNYPLQDRIYTFIKRQTPVFFILEDVLRSNQDSLQDLTDEASLQKAVFASCGKRYKSIAKKVRTALVRSVIFLLLTKAIFAFGIEGTYEKFRYNEIHYFSIVLNTLIPPLLMVVMSLFITVPKQKNSEIIFFQIKKLLFTESPELVEPLQLMARARQMQTGLFFVFRILSLLAFVLSFGIIFYMLHLLQFNIVSQAIFVFFLTVVSFLSYRISQTAHMYTVEQKQGILTPVVDFLFLPVIKVGMQLTEGVSQVNLLIFLFDFLIESPFKTMFAFFEQWFGFLHAKREELA